MMEGPGVAHGSDEQPAQSFRGHDAQVLRDAQWQLGELVLGLVGTPRSSG